MDKGNWIWKDNLLAFLLILSDIASYSFDESDWEAVKCGLTGTSDEQNTWFDYVLAGNVVISIKLANDPEEDLIIYNLSYPDTLQEKLDLLENILSKFKLTPRNFSTGN
ncbi:hypothetical protein [Chitinophaga sp. YIM B06452]|uniref:hypothetical protein n=1 Tax=Chitinophaga sp. YIM B06452 TaxID=3082158 RepID=UPI0031FEC095